MAVFTLLEDAFAFGALGNLPGAADLTMSPLASIAAAPSVKSRKSAGNAGQMSL